MEHQHTPATAEALSQRYPGRTQRSTRICLWGRHHPGHGLLSPRKSFLQRLGALCAERRLCPGSAARLQRSRPLRICARGSLSLLRGQRRSPHGRESFGAPLVSEAEKKYGDVITYEENPLAHVKTE